MADLKITSMTSLAAATANEDVLHIIDDPTGTPINKKVTVGEMLNALKAPVELAAGAVSITEALHSGRISIIPDQSSAGALTLPVPKPGMVFRFHYGGAAIDAENTTIAPVGDEFFNGSLAFYDRANNTTSVVVSDNAADDLITLINPENFEVTCTAVSTTEWHISGYVNADTAPTIA